MSHSARNTEIEPSAEPGEAVLEANRHLLHPAVAERGRDREQLEVEGELLHEQQRKDLVDDPSAEDLQPDLRVAHVEPKEQPVQLLVHQLAIRRERG